MLLRYFSTRLRRAAPAAAPAILVHVIFAVLLAAGFLPAPPARAQNAGGVEGVDFIVVEGDTIPLAAPLEIVGAIVPAALPGLTRNLEMLSAEDLAVLPGRSFAEQLQTVPGVTVSQRQQYGVQSDLSIRGSSFEQVQMLLDGYDISDPQTGHHLMNLPVGRGDIQRLEVLPGHGSVQYGAGGFGGTVNVVTRRPGERSGLRAAVLGGGQATWGLEAAADLVADENNAVRFSLENLRTDGHEIVTRDGRRLAGANDADTWSGTGRLIHAHADGETDIQVGVSRREFGALGFYAPYPSWERTETVFAAARVNHRLSDGFHIEPRVFFRRHDDRFVLLRDDPAAYTNEHRTRKYGSNLRGILDLGARNTLSLGLEGVYEDIDSRGLRSGLEGPALGYHLRRRLAVAAELDNNAGDAIWQLGARLDSREGFAPRLTVTGALGYCATDHLSLRASAGTVHRVPTFTELHYSSPTDLGDPDLEAESGWTWDAGAEWNRGRWRARSTFFQRHEDDLIEWARPAGADRPWRAMNLARARVQGLENLLSWRHGGGHLLSAGYTWLERDTELPSGFEGKYALLSPRHQVLLQGTLVLPRGLGLTLTGRYLERPAGPADFRHHFVLDGRLDWTSARGLFAGLTATNILDRRYEEIPGVPMSGFLLTGRLGVVF